MSDFELGVSRIEDIVETFGKYDIGLSYDSSRALLEFSGRSVEQALVNLSNFVDALDREDMNPEGETIDFWTDLGDGMNPRRGRMITVGDQEFQAFFDEDGELNAVKTVVTINVS